MDLALGFILQIFSLFSWPNIQFTISANKHCVAWTWRKLNPMLDQTIHSLSSIQLTIPTSKIKMHLKCFVWFAFLLHVGSWTVLWWFAGRAAGSFPRRRARCRGWAPTWESPGSGTGCSTLLLTTQTGDATSHFLHYQVLLNRYFMLYCIYWKLQFETLKN